jgi:hypothetical protein
MAIAGGSSTVGGLGANALEPALEHTRTPGLRRKDVTSAAFAVQNDEMMAFSGHNGVRCSEAW